MSAAASPRARLVGPPASPPRHRTLVEALVAAASHASGVTFVDLAEREVAIGWSEVAERAVFGRFANVVARRPHACWAGH